MDNRPAWPWILFAGITLIAFLSLAHPLPNLSAAAISHAVLAVGALPLILAAMIYFTPTLTRSGPPPRSILLAPLAALAAGGMAMMAANGSLIWIHPAATLGIGAALATALWMGRRAKRCLGAPHPGLRWYQWALGMLLAALLSMAMAAVWTEQWQALRSFHLHLNLLGFVGMTAIGTLQVLIPTAGGFSDPDAHRRLALDWKYALAGSIISAISAGWLRPLSALGLILWAIPLTRMVRGLWRQGGAALWASETALLSGALAGFILMMVASAMIPLGLVNADDSLPLFFSAFLFPLVSGALGRLLPMWRWPGPSTPARERALKRLATAGRLRALIFFCAGVMVAMGNPQGIPLALLGLAWLLLLVLWSLITPGPTHTDSAETT
ncbi:MAG: hypothetical protein HQL53_00580 [Magnetococcales bacterium]|nr:hypothetical protein [Magnetococcales bacterium]